jgi:hypothetical protein
MVKAVMHFIVFRPIGRRKFVLTIHRKQILYRPTVIGVGRFRDILEMPSVTSSIHVCKFVILFRHINIKQDASHLTTKSIHM